jgi:hypothetical protein
MTTKVTSQLLNSITSNQIINGLGYTPYNTTNPAGYITSSASITGNALTATNPQSGGSFITSNNIGSQSVNYASSAGNASTVNNGVYNNGGTYSINITGSSGYAGSAGSAGSINSGGGLQNMSVNNIGSIVLASTIPGENINITWNGGIGGGALYVAFNIYSIYCCGYYSTGNYTTLPGSWRFLGGVNIVNSVNTVAGLYVRYA